MLNLDCYLDGSSSSMKVVEKPGEDRALFECAYLMAKYFSASVVNIPGASKEHSFPREWDLKKGMARAVFAAFGIHVYQPEHYVSTMQWVNEIMGGNPLV